MKRYSILALALVLGCTVFTGCRRGNGNMETISPTVPPATEMTTMPTTAPTTLPTEPIVTVPATEGATHDSTEGTTADSNGGTTESTEAARGRTGTQRSNMP